MYRTNCALLRTRNLRGMTREFIANLLTASCSVSIILFKYKWLIPYQSHLFFLLSVQFWLFYYFHRDFPSLRPVLVNNNFVFIVYVLGPFLLIVQVSVIVHSNNSQVRKRLCRKGESPLANRWIYRTVGLADKRIVDLAFFDYTF